MPPPIRHKVVKYLVTIVSVDKILNLERNYYKVLVVEKVDVAIIGGGPGGATLANILASRGVSTALIERQKDFSKEFRGEGLMPSGKAVLEQIGFDLDGVDY